MEIPKNIAQFVTRDLVFIVGGAGVGTSFLCWRNWSLVDDLQPVYILLVLGVAYATGFAIQELFSFLGVVTTNNVYRPKRLMVRMFERYDHCEWPDDIKDTCEDEVRSYLLQHPPNDHWYANHQRIITHMMIGSTLAPCAFVSGVFVLLRYVSESDLDFLVFGVACILLALVLWPIGWFKAMQVTVREVKRCGQKE